MLTNVNVDRRTFVCGATVALGAAGLMATSAHADDEPAQEAADVPAETYECDIVVVGAGVAGLAASVEASELGASVIQLDKRESTGGWGVGTEGVAGVGTSIQTEQGVEVTPVEVIKREAEYTHSRINNMLWIDIIDNSADNFTWMAEKGVRFSGVVDDYRGSGHGLNVFHWFETGTAAESYAQPMTAAAEAQGVQIMLNTRGYALELADDGSVAGVRATTGDGTEISISCRAVILATGGVAGNPEYVRHGGYNMDNLFQSYPDMTGDGLTMALEAGAEDTLGSISALEVIAIGDQPSGSYATYTRNGTGPAATAANTMWVNALGERFCAEDAGSDNWMATESAIKPQKTSYSFFNQAILDANMLAMYPDDQETLDGYMADFNEMVDDGGRGAIKADTIEELVDLAVATFEGLDAQTLLGSIETYNEMCNTGSDDLFGKPVESMVAMEEGPFYLCRHYQTVCVTFGAIKTDRSFEALNSDDDPIPGLYAVGVDGVMLWPNIYTINVPGGANANNINSGRTAARHAYDYING